MPATSTARVTQLPAVTRPALLERDEEIRALEAALLGAASGRGATLRIEAASGLGKTALLEIARELAGQRGFLVLDAEASAIDRDLPLALVHKLFASLPAGGDEWVRVESQLRAAAAGDDGALLELLHALVLFSADRPVLVAIDDLDRGDEQSLRFFEHLAFRSHHQRLLLVGTGTAKAGPGAVLSPQPLSLEATASIACATLGSPAPAFSAACHRLAGGNPYFVHKLIAEAADAGLAPTAEHAWTLETLAPRPVAEAVGARLARLAAEAGALTAALAVLGDGTPVGQAARLAELDLDTAERAADELAAADILAPERPLAFAQPIVRAALYGQLPPGSRATAHRKAVRVLRDAGASTAAQTEHALAVEPAGDLVLAEVLLRAGEEALAAGTPRRAVHLLERSLAESPDGHTAAVGLLGRALVRLGDPRAAALLHEALVPAPDELIDALWLGGDAEAALELQRESAGDLAPGIAAATAAREGTLAAETIVSLAREGVTGDTALERCCAVAALIACDEFDEAERVLAEGVEVATRNGASAELARLELLRARLSALGQGDTAPSDLFFGPDPGPAPWDTWLAQPPKGAATLPESVKSFGSVSACAAGWIALAAQASGAARLDALNRAVGLLRESPRPLALALALTELGRSLRHAGSRVEARGVLREALDRAQRLGAVAIAELAQAELRIAGARPRRESLSGPDSLTAGERRVVETAAQGLTNREIATELFLSTKTVEMHLSRSYRKLDIASRAELQVAMTTTGGLQ